MLIRFFRIPWYSEPDKGDVAGTTGNDKPAGDPPAKPNSASDDWRDARITELNNEAATRRREGKSLNDQVLQLTGQVAQLQTELQSREKTTQETLLRTSVIAAAATAGFHDPADAWTMVNKTGLKLKEDGTVEGLEGALKTLAEAKPYLIRSTEQVPAKPPPPAKPAASSPGNSGSKVKLTRDALLKMTPQDIAKRLSDDPEFAKEMEEAQRS